MADEVIKRDANHRTVGAAVTDDANQFVTMLRVDPATNYLLVNIASVGATAGVAGQVAKRDQNHRPVCLAWNESAQEVQEILMDDDGNLLCDVISI